MSDQNVTPPSQPPAPSAPPVATQPQPSGSKGLAITALILGIVAIVFAFIPVVNFFSYAPAAVAIILGIIVLAKKKPGKGMGLTGLILGGASIVIAIIVTIVSVVALSSLSELETTTTPDTTLEEEESAQGGGEQSDTVDIPAGFEDLDTGVAFRFIEANCMKYDLCVPVELFAYTDCREGVEVFANEIDYDTEAVFGQTQESAGPLLAGETANIEIPIADQRANGVIITDIQCLIP